MIKPQLVACFAIVLSITAVRWASAQFPYSSPGGQGISATATEQMELKPQKLRLLMWVKAQGTDAKSAIQSLSKHRDRVQTDLKSMKAVESSIAFSAPRVASSEGNSRESQMMQQMRQMQMMRGGGSSPNMDAMPTIYTAMCAVKAEWELPIQEGDALAMIPSSLKAQIETRDLEGKNNKPELDAKAQEQMEEMQAMMEEQYGGFSYSSNEQSGPRILFVASVDEQQVAAATKSAFEAAAAKAKTLAAAAGLELGSLVSLTSSSESDFDYSSYASSYYSGMGGEQKLPASFAGKQPTEIVAANADDLVKNVAVNVAYAIE